MSLNVVIPPDKEKLERQIAALKYLIENDTNEKDRQIHKDMLRQLEAAFKEISL